MRANPNLKVIAVDPNVIPLGSKVWVEGYGYAIAGDTGGAIKGKKIDLHVPTKTAAYNFGRRQVKIKVSLTDRSYIPHLRGAELVPRFFIIFY